MKRLVSSLFVLCLFLASITSLQANTHIAKGELITISFDLCVVYDTADSEDKEKFNDKFFASLYFDLSDTVKHLFSYYYQNTTKPSLAVVAFAIRAPPIS